MSRYDEFVKSNKKNTKNCVGESKTSENNLESGRVPPLTHLCDQIRVADNGSHKEAVVRNLCAHLHTGCTQIQVHLVVSTWDGS